MITKKNLVIAVLATFCLTASLFMTVGTSGTSTTPQYDPWIDINDDGTINVLDLILVANGLGGTGDPINKTALLLELQSRVETLEAQTHSSNQTLEVLINQSFGVPEFLYSNGGYFDLVKMGEQGTTGWVTAKTAIIPANTLKNGTIVVYLNWVSYYYLDSSFGCYVRILVAGVEKAYWSWAPPINNPPASYLPMDTYYEAVKLSGIDNSVDVTLNLDLKIDCLYTSNPTQAYARISNNQFMVVG